MHCIELDNNLHIVIIIHRGNQALIIALFQNISLIPSCSHLQYLITYSMQIRSGKAWEIWSRAVTSCTQMVDTQGAVPDSSNSHFVSNRPWRHERSVYLT